MGEQVEIQDVNQLVDVPQPPIVQSGSTQNSVTVDSDCLVAVEEANTAVDVENDLGVVVIENTDNKVVDVGTASVGTAQNISIADAGSFYSSSNVEGALQEIGAGSISLGTSDTQVLFNNGGVIDGDASLTYTLGTKTFLLGNDVMLAFGTDETRTIMYDSAATNWDFTGNMKFLATIDAEFTEGLETNYIATGTDPSNRVAFLFSLTGDYSGDGTCTGISFDVTVNDCRADSYIDDTSLFGFRAAGVRGITGFSRGETDALRIGGQFGAGGSSLANYAVWGTTTITRAGAQNIAVIGVSENVAGTEFAIVGYFGSQDTAPVTRSASVVGLFDNGILVEDILAAQNASVDVFLVDKLSNTVVGKGTTTTTRTDEFLYIPTTAGAPTGTPTAYAGRTPMAYDTVNDEFYMYNGSWRSVALT